MGGKLIIKGILDSEDALLAAKTGADAIIVSNHGGRQLDHTKACIDALPEVASAVAGRVPVVVDGGFMRGADVVKGLCLGADFVGMGRFEGLAMAAGGAAGLMRGLKILEQEIRISMALLGASDLASLKTTANRDGEEYVVNGTKIWTSMAHHSNWIFCLVRTDKNVKPQAGISFLLIDMATPGITVAPFPSLDGEVEQCQVFFENVRVPVANLLGEENQGWTVAKYLLEFERGGQHFTIETKKQLGNFNAPWRTPTVAPSMTRPTPTAWPRLRLM